jgi:hypothetical protein
MRTSILCFVLAVLAAAAAAAAEKKSDDLRMVSFTSHTCKTKLEPGTPGSSPDMPIVLEYFSQAHDDAANAKDQPEGKPPKLSKYECKWVELTGYMTYTNYYHYRGDLRESAWKRYGSAKTRYLVEWFRDERLRRFDVLRRQMTVVGRFYDLCAAADRAEKEAGQSWWLFGPCHYGSNNGMMLADVIVKTVHDDRPRYLLSESNRDLVGELPPVEGADLAPLESRTRDWAAAIKRGPAAYAKETLSLNPRLTDLKPKDRKEIEENIRDADNYAAHLHRNDAFRQLNAATAPVAVFWAGESEAKEKTAAWGCICLRESCTDRWPLLKSDAYRFIGDAACTELTRKDTTAPWRWE